MRGQRCLVAAAFAASVVGLSPATAETVLRVKPFGDLKLIDPIITSDYMVRNHGYMVYDTLFALDEQLNAQPQMLESWSLAKDQLTYSFTLRSGITFSDGKPVTSEDVVASLKRWWQRDGLGQQLAAVAESLTAKDDKTFELKLKQPWGMVIDALSKPSSNVPFIMPKAIRFGAGRHRDYRPDRFGPLHHEEGRVGAGLQGGVPEEPDLQAAAGPAERIGRRQARAR